MACSGLLQVSSGGARPRYMEILQVFMEGELVSVRFPASGIYIYKELDPRFVLTLMLLLAERSFLWGFYLDYVSLRREGHVLFLLLFLFIFILLSSNQQHSASQ